MRVALLTNLTARASLPVLTRLTVSEQVQLRHVFFYDTLAVGRASPWQVLRQFGLKTVCVKVAELVSSKLRVKLGRLLGARRFKPCSAFELAVFSRLPHSLTSDMNTDEAQARLRELGVDVLVVCVCKNILRAALLDSPDLQFINIHPSLLPYYRGPTPTFWMLYHGERETGYTIHRMTPRIDQGAILAQRGLPLDAQKTEQQIELEVFAAAAEDLEKTLLNLSERTLETVATADSAAGSYYTYPTPAQRSELRARLTIKNN